MAQPAHAAQQPLDQALRTKVEELFGDTARLHAGETFEREPLLEIRTVLGLKEADRRLREIEAWLVDQYPYDDTVVGLLHVARL